MGNVSKRKFNAAARLARTGVLTALAILLVFVEQLMPPLMVFAPGAKIGLGNAVVLLALITLGEVDAAAILLIKCVFGALFSGNMFGFVYGLGGGSIAYLAMSLMLRYTRGKISVVAISVTGAACHNVVQTCIASLVAQQINLLWLLPFMLIASVLAGIVVGAVVYLLVKFVPTKIWCGRDAAMTMHQCKTEDRA